MRIKFGGYGPGSTHLFSVDIQLWHNIWFFGVYTKWDWWPELGFLGYICFWKVVGL